MANPVLESFGESPKACVTNSSYPPEKLKGKEYPDLPLVCSNYWPPNVALRLASEIDTSLYYMLMYFPANSLVDREIGATSEPCCIRDPIVNQKLFAKLN